MTAEESTMLVAAAKHDEFMASVVIVDCEVTMMVDGKEFLVMSMVARKRYSACNEFLWPAINHD